MYYMNHPTKKILKQNTISCDKPFMKEKNLLKIKIVKKSYSILTSNSKHIIKVNSYFINKNIL